MIFALLILAAALAISSVSAYFSIIGLTTIFPAAVIAVTIMAIVLEIAKVISVSFLHRYWLTSPKFIKFYLIIVVIVLMFINSLGIYGYLSRAHIDQQAIVAQNTTSSDVIDAQLDDDKARLQDVNNQIQQIDNALSKLTQQGKAQTSLAQANTQRKQRENLVTQKAQIMGKVEYETGQKVSQESKNKLAQADFGPLTYLARMIYDNPTQDQLETTVRWIITVIVCIFDPTALALLVASQFLFLRRGKGLTAPPKHDTMDLQHFNMGINEL